MNNSQISLVSLDGDKSSSCLAIKLRTIYNNKPSNQTQTNLKISCLQVENHLQQQTKQSNSNESKNLLPGWCTIIFSSKQVESHVPCDSHSAEQFPSFLPIYPRWSARDSESLPWNQLWASQTSANLQLFHGASSGDHHELKESHSFLSKSSETLGSGLQRASPRFAKQTC